MANLTTSPSPSTSTSASTSTSTSTSVVTTKAPVTRPYNALMTATILIFSLMAHQVTSVTVSGLWSPMSSSLKVVARFGFVKSDVHNRDRTDGYIFGNITFNPELLPTVTLLNGTTSKYQPTYVNSSENTWRKVQSSSSSSSSSSSPSASSSSSSPSSSTLATILLVERTTLNRIIEADVESQRINLFKSGQFTGQINCSVVFSTLAYLASYDEKKICPFGKPLSTNNVTNSGGGGGASDFIRYLPCVPGGICPGGSNVQRANSQITRSQLTFVIKDQKQPTFWYLLFVACKRDESCGWVNSNDTTVYQYNLKLVNGRPDLSSGNIFTYHFSYEEQDMILYIVMLALYVTLTIFQMYAVVKQRHRNLLVFLFTMSLVMHCLSFFLSTIHKVVFAQNGIGYKTLYVISDVIRITSLALFILFALIIAKGWPMTRSSVSGKPLLFLAWMAYIAIDLILFVWIKNSLDVVKEIDEYHTLPGWISLLFRTILMLWFLCELRSTMMIEQNQLRLRFYLHFGAGIMVWFVHLPIVTIIGLQISLLMRYKLIMGFSSAANILAYACVTHFMWPTKMNYLFLTHPMDADFSQEELEDYDHEVTESFGYYNNPNYTTPNGNNHSHRNSTSSKVSRSRSKTRFSIDSQTLHSNHVKA